MHDSDKIDIHVLKAVTGAVAASGDPGVMAGTLTQLLVGTLGIQGCTIFALHPASGALEVLASFGLSVSYVAKGPVLSRDSIAATLRGEPVVIADVSDSDQLQYPEQARAEGIRSIVSVPIAISGENIGALRLYHHEVWNVSAQDLESLLLVAEIVGLALRYAQMSRALDAIRGALDQAALL